MGKVVFRNKEGVDDTVSLALWLDVIGQANLMEDLDHAIVGCSKDRDNKCRCINNWVAAPIFNRKKLLRLKEKALEWLKKQKNFEPKIEKLFVIENVKQFFRITSLLKLKEEIKKIKYTSAINEVEEVFNRIISIDSKRNEVAIADAFDEINAYPCSREIAVNVFVDQSRKMRATKNILLDWHYASENQEIIRKIREESWKKLLSEEEVLKRGVKIAITGE